MSSVHFFDPSIRFQFGGRPFDHVLASSLPPERVARCFGCASFQQWDQDLACIHPNGPSCVRALADAYAPWGLRIVSARLDAEGLCIGIEGADHVPVQAYRFQAVELLQSRDSDLLADVQVEVALQGLDERAPDGEPRTLYYGEWDGFVWFCIHDPKHPHGYGGRPFRFHMRDGTQRVVKGPWSGSEGLLSRYGLGPVHTVSFVHPQSGRGSLTLTDARYQELVAAAPFGPFPGSEHG